MEDMRSDFLSTTYQIRVQGRIDETWTRWLGGWNAIFEREALDSEINLITATVLDQSSLRGILNKIWDMNMTLLSLTQIGVNKDKETAHG